MSPIRFAPIFCFALCSVACGGAAESTVNSGTGANTGIPEGQPPLDIGGTSGNGVPKGNGGGADANGGPCGANLTGRVRDFRAADEPMGHADFETFSGNGASPGIVQDLLGTNQKPVYKPTGPLVSMYGPQSTDQAHFDQWYVDTEGVNQAIDFLVPLGKPDAKGIRNYDNGAFFPIDGKGFGNYKDSGHNFHFTFELHTKFLYKAGDEFKFTGDDDLWVFVNGHLGIDLGGLHPEVTKTLVLDEVAQAFGLQVGQTYPLDLFHAERHTNASHFRVETSIDFTNCKAIIIPK